MTGLPLGMVVEGTVAVLLIVTIGYCMVLNQRLKRLHADRDALKQMVADLMQATTLANSAIKGLKEAATEADAVLTSRLEEADSFAVELANHVNAGRSIMDKIAKLTDAARQRQAAPSEIAAVKPSAMPTPESVKSEARGAQAALERLVAHRKLRETAA